MTTEWLTADVPLWAFLVAVLTRPAVWSRYAKNALAERYAAFNTQSENE
jgi:hypothetical protein